MNDGLNIRADGSKEWWLNDKLHREDGPAIEGADGSKFWYLNGKLHREDGPAIEKADGSKGWYLNGKRHRIDGPAIEGADGSKFWYLNGECKREPKTKIQRIEQLMIKIDKMQKTLSKLKSKP